MIISLLVLIIINIFVSYIGFTKNQFFDKYKFDLGMIFNNKQFYRLISYSFLHRNWKDLFLNIFYLFFFTPILINNTSEIFFLVTYFISLCGGSIFMILLNKNNLNYYQVGSSGGVTGIIFSSIYLSPENIIKYFSIEIPIWIFGIFYLIQSFYIYKKETYSDTIKYEMYIGGGILGSLIIIIYHLLI